MILGESDVAVDHAARKFKLVVGAARVKSIHRIAAFGSLDGPGRLTRALTGSRPALAQSPPFALASCDAKDFTFFVSAFARRLRPKRSSVEARRE
jgi:hypothetical protein